MRGGGGGEREPGPTSVTRGGGPRPLEGTVCEEWRYGGEEWMWGLTCVVCVLLGKGWVCTACLHRAWMLCGVALRGDAFLMRSSFYLKNLTCVDGTLFLP